MLSIVEEFLAQAKSATTEHLAEAVITDALAKGAHSTMLRTAVHSLLTGGQDLDRPLGSEAAHRVDTPEKKNLFRVWQRLQHV